MIEKVFHQIWINDEQPDLSDEAKRLRDTWIEKHPSWVYRLWNLDNLDFEPRCAGLLKQCQHPAQMADLLRMEILHKHGGVYFDTDFECLRPFDDILEGVEDFTCSEDSVYLSIGLLGARRQSPLFESVIRQFPDRLGLKPVNVETGPAFFTGCVLRGGFKNDLTVFPSHLFYPFNYHTPNRESVDTSNSYAVHHYADSWKKRVPDWRRALSVAKRILIR
ncbi:glycosyltransferase family 32 protein [Woeseia oceani]|uniref:Mannosyltransferase n=1 Tax=Woeseia oceani TaxID=1548547 RepID=A0A193LEW5_9GAMM|nr:glycosyltransferase [Woeseia oceani]ANO50924.1 hypothetical protein BA177_06640 [Woeseia oceani]